MDGEIDLELYTISMIRLNSIFQKIEDENKYTRKAQGKQRGMDRYASYSQKRTIHHFYRQRSADSVLCCLLGLSDGLRIYLQSRSDDGYARCRC